MPEPKPVFLALSGEETKTAILSDFIKLLDSRGDLFNRAIAYPRLAWKIELSLSEWYEADEKIGEVPVATLKTEQSLGEADGDPKQHTLKTTRRVTAPDAVRKEIGAPSGAQQMNIKEDHGEAARLLSGGSLAPIKVSRP